jgi:hypothetical protein
VDTGKSPDYLVFIGHIDAFGNVAAKGLPSRLPSVDAVMLMLSIKQ